VHDDIAREFCDHFCQALVEQTRNGSSSQRDYRGAFDAATDAMRVHAFTGGAVRPAPEAATFYGLWGAVRRTTPTLTTCMK
jgi:hypothetical protein